MSGECKSYRMNSPMKWQEFRAMPRDLQIAYIKAVKEKYNPPVVAMAKMMCCDRANLSRYLISLGFEKSDRGPRTWDKMGFAEWCFNLTKTEECQSVQEEVKEEAPVEEVMQTEDVTIAEDDLPWNKPEEEEIEPVAEPVHRTYVSLDNMRAIPEVGSLTFTGNATQIMNTLVNLLGNTKVMLSVNWNALEE